MPTTPKNAGDAKADFSGETYRVINSLAAALTQATLKSSPTERERIGKEFSRVYEILAKRLAEIYAKATPTKKQELEKASRAVIAGIVTRPPICCVGNPSATTLEECEEGGGTWACHPAPIHEPLTP